MAKNPNPIKTFMQFFWPEPEPESTPPAAPDPDSSASPDKQPKKMPPLRSRNYCCIIYPDNPSHVEAIAKLMQGYQFAAILHNEDVYEDGEHKGEKKKPHWHVVVKFRNAVFRSALSKELGIEENLLQKCSSLEGALLYLVHFGYEGTKYQYNVDEVFGPLKQKLITLLDDDDEGTKALHILDIIEKKDGPIGYSELLKESVAAGLYSDLRRMGNFATCLVREHNDPYYRNEWDAIDNSLDRDRFRTGIKVKNGG